MTEDQLDLSLIKISGGTQSRVGISESVVTEYLEAMREGANFPPLEVFHDGQEYWLADGFHRYHAACKMGWRGMPVRIHQGTRRDAILHSVSANAVHGLRRTNADKQRAVEVLLRDEEWQQWSDREIARRCGVGNQMVSQLRKSICVNHTDTKLNSERTVARNGTTYTQKVKATASEIPSLDAELEKSRRESWERGKGGFITVAQPEKMTTVINTVIAEEKEDDIKPNCERDWTEEEWRTDEPTPTLYKVGDEVRVLESWNNENIGRAGLVVGCRNENMLAVEIGIGAEAHVWTFELHEIELIKALPTPYKVGDEVKIINSWNKEDIGEVCQIIGIIKGHFDDKIAVEINGKKRGFTANEIEVAKTHPGGDEIDLQPGIIKTDDKQSELEAAIEEEEFVLPPTMKIDVVAIIDDIKQTSPEQLAWIVGYAANNNGLSDDHLKSMIKVCKTELNKRNHPEYVGGKR